MPAPECTCKIKYDPFYTGDADDEGFFIEKCDLCKSAPKLYEACERSLEFRDWVIAAGGTKGPLNQSVIEQFAKMQLEVTEKTEAALAEARGTK